MLWWYYYACSTGAPAGYFAGRCNLWLIAPTFLLQCIYKEKNWCFPNPSVENSLASSLFNCNCCQCHLKWTVNASFMKFREKKTWTYYLLYTLLNLSYCLWNYLSTTATDSAQHSGRYFSNKEKAKGPVFSKFIVALLTVLKGWPFKTLLNHRLKTATDIRCHISKKTAKQQKHCIKYTTKQHNYKIPVVDWVLSSSGSLVYLQNT